MASSTDICNRALQMAMARSTITSLVDGTNEANQCTLIYTSTLSWCLGVTNWNFAHKTAVLVQTRIVPPNPVTWDNTRPPPPWFYEYQYPADCLRIRTVTNMNVIGTKWVGNPTKFQVAIEAGGTFITILSDQPFAIANYTMNLTTVDLWDALFQQALVTQLAWKLAAALSGKEELVLKLIQVADQSMSLAVLANTHEGLVMDDTGAEWVTARGIVAPDRRPDSVMTQTRQPQEARNGRR